MNTKSKLTPLILAAILGACVTAIPMFATGNELVFAGRTAQEAFRDDGVVNLLKAVIKSDAIEAKRLIDSGVNVNALGLDGVTPLIWMQGVNDLNAMKLLLEFGADPNQFEVDGIGTPVWLAAGGGRKEVLNLLLNHGGNPNLVYGNDSPLTEAISNLHLDCAQLLLQSGADINSHEGHDSAMSAAMLVVRFDYALWLIEHGYTYDLPMARRMLEIKNPRSGQEALKIKALAEVDRLLADK